MTLPILFPDYVTEHKRQVSFWISLAVARYIAKQHDKDRKNDHCTALSHHSKALKSRQKRAPSERSKWNAAGVMVRVTAQAPILTGVLLGITSLEAAIH